MFVLPCRDLIAAQVSRLDSTECKLWDKDFKLPSDKFNALSPPQRNNVGQSTIARGPCFNCGQNGHFANRCPQKQHNPSAVQSVNQTPNHSTNTTTSGRQNQVCARVNHVAMEDAQAALDVIIGMILVNDNNAIVLFDSGASHSFVAASFVQKYNLPLSMLKNQIIVSSPGGDMYARHVCSKVSILIRG
jgi:hypothetical protein